MLDSMQAGAGRIHPAREDALVFIGGCDFIHLGEGRRLRRFGRGPGVADARRDLERTKLHGFVNRHFKRDDAPGDLVETGKNSRGMLDLVGQSGRGETAEQCQRA